MCNYVPVDIFQENEDGTEILLHIYGIYDRATKIMFGQTYLTEKERDLKLNSILGKFENEKV